MKLKTKASDFQVTELTDFLAQGGAFSLYRLNKSSLGTPEAINAILRSWNLPRDRIGYGGMKDRHAQTMQYVTIFKGPRKDLKDRSFSLTFVGQAARHFTAQDITGNHFSIQLRGIARQHVTQLSHRIGIIQRFGLINYFDEQRFGSLGVSGRFIAEPWCKGDYEAALYLALAESNRHDAKREAEQKAILRESWGDWNACKSRLDRSHRRSIVTFLVDHPTRYKRAISLIRSDLRSIYVAAFQSALWNRWLSKIVYQKCHPQLTVVPSVAGPLAFPTVVNADTVQRQLSPDHNLVQRVNNRAGDKPSAESQCNGESVAQKLQDPSLQWLRTLKLPLPSARQHDWPSEYVTLLDEVLDEFQMSRRDLRLKYPRDTFFSKGFRECWLNVKEFEFQWQEDDLHPGRQSLLLNFQLPRGAYATMIVKMLQTL